MTLFDSTENQKEDISYKNALYVYAIGKMSEILTQKLKEQEELELFKTIDMPTIEVLANMQWNGMKVNENDLIEFGRQLKEGLNSLTQEIYELAGEEFNINSPKQLGEILFDKMKLTVTMEDATFYVQEDKGKVVCVIPNTQGMARRFLEDNSKISPECDYNYALQNGGHGSKLYKELEMPNRFVGVASCAEGDTFDEDLGRTIAFHKDKLYKSMFKKFNMFVNEIDSYIDELTTVINNFGAKLSENSARREKYIQTLVGSDEEETESENE